MGDQLYAVEYGGGMYKSADQGATWSLLAGAGTGAWESVAVSQDGLKVAAVIQNGPLVLSSNGGATWHTAVLPDGQAAHWWRAISSSSDGSVLVAASHNGEIYRSTDSGSTWQRVTVTVNGTAVTETWYRVRTSADGRTIAVVANTFGGAPGTGIYVSHDGGATWSKGFSLVTDYTFIAMSADGQRIAVTVSNTSSTVGRVLLSVDGGATFTQVSVQGSGTDWRAIAMSAAGDHLAAAVGGFDTGTTGLLYVAH